jgi:hypothetical protein
MSPKLVEKIFHALNKGTGSTRLPLKQFMIGIVC